MSWEVLPRHRGRRNLPPDVVSVHNNGRLNVASIVDELGSYVELFYDRDTHRLGLKPSEHGLDSFAVKKYGGSCSVAIVGAMNTLGLDIRGNKYKVVREDGMFIIDLNNPIT